MQNICWTETNKSVKNWIKAQIYLREWWSANGETPWIFTNLKLVIYMENGYIEHNDRFSTNSESTVFETSVDDD